MDTRFFKTLSFQQACYTVLSALAVGIVSMVIQLFGDAMAERHDLRERVEGTLQLFHETAVLAAYRIDENTGRNIGHSLMLDPVVSRFELVSDTGTTLVDLQRASSKPAAADQMDRRFYCWLGRWLLANQSTLTHRLVYRVPGAADKGTGTQNLPPLDVGMIRLSLDGNSIAHSFIAKYWRSFLNELGKSLALGLIMAVIVHMLVTTPLVNLARQLARVNPFNLKPESIPLPQRFKHSELGFLITRMNIMFATIALKSEEVAEKQRNLIQSEERLRLAATATRSGLWDIDLVAGSCWISPELRKILGYDAMDGLDSRQAIEALIHPEDRALTLSRIDACLLGIGVTLRQTYRMLRKDGSWAWIKDHRFIVRDTESRPLRMIGLMNDISNQKRTEDQLKHLATHDQLTNLANRTLIQERLIHAIKAASQLNHKVAVLFVDVDRFKVVNDTMGHNVGDALLRELAARFLSVIDDSHTLGRLGGDEFVVMVETAHASHEIAYVAQSIIASLAAPFVIEDQSLTMAISVGISIFPDDADSVTTLMRHADTAMYAAKTQTGNSYRFYTRSMHDEVAARLELERKLHEAIEKQQFELWYQPKVDAGTTELLGFEGLIRWRLPDGGMVSPLDFIPVAEETGLIVAIGRWVVEEACRQLAEWKQVGLKTAPIAVNISTKELINRQVVLDVEASLVKFNIRPDEIDVEITETVMADNFPVTRAILQELRNLGVSISVDDFGAGYSSLAYLKQLPITALKIDRAFVRDLPDDHDDVTITAAIIDLGHRLGLKVIAEGVETEAQRLLLSELGCDGIQGYLISRPLPAAEIAAKFLRPDSGNA